MLFSNYGSRIWYEKLKHLYDCLFYSWFRSWEWGGDVGEVSVGNFVLIFELSGISGKDDKVHFYGTFR
jgi:hypothetical protein